MLLRQYLILFAGKENCLFDLICSILKSSREIQVLQTSTLLKNSDEKSN
jgi:hypothetical protein